MYIFESGANFPPFGDINAWPLILGKDAKIDDIRKNSHNEFKKLNYLHA